MNKQNFYRTVLTNVIAYQREYREVFQAAHYLHQGGTHCYIAGRFAAMVGLGVSEPPVHVAIFVTRNPKPHSMKQTLSPDALARSGRFPKMQPLTHGKVKQVVDGCTISYRPIGGLWWPANTPVAERVPTQLPYLFSLSPERIAVRLFTDTVEDGLIFDSGHSLYVSYRKKSVAVVKNIATRSPSTITAVCKAASEIIRHTNWEPNSTLQKVLSGEIKGSHTKGGFFEISDERKSLLPRHKLV